MLLNLSAIENLRMNSEPFNWGFIPEVFQTPEIARELAASFPDDGYNHYTRHSTAKQYDTYGRFLIKMGHGVVHEPDDQPPLWRAFGEELLSPAYVGAVERATGVPLVGTHLEAVYWRLTEGCVIDPHLDSPLKLVSHLFYFSESWDDTYGGCFRILHSHRIDDYVHEFPPLVNTSVLFVRSGRSWHGYKPIRGPHVRKAVQISLCQCAAV
jgi:SM-20-related protein